MLGIILAVLAVIMRFYSLHHLHYVYLYGDMVHYDHAAMMMWTHHVFSYWGTTPDAFVTPGYPLFLMICYRVANIFTHSHQGQLIFTVYIQAVLSGLTVGLVYYVARNVMNAWWALLAALIWMYYPPSIWSMTLLLTETLYVFLLLGYVWMFYYSMKKNKAIWWFLSGLLLALTALVRPTVFPLAIAPVIWAIWKRESLRKGIRTILIYIIGFVVPLLPWWIRNMVVMHRLLLTDNDTGNPLLYGTDPNFQHDPGLAQGVKDQKALAIHRIVEGFTTHPWATLKWYTLDKLHYLFSHAWFYPSKVTRLESFLLGFHFIWVCLGTLGILLGFMYLRFRFLSILAVFFVLIQLVFIPINRYAFPLMPLFVIAACFLGQQVLSLVQQRLRTAKMTT